MRFYLSGASHNALHNSYTLTQNLTQNEDFNKFLNFYQQLSQPKSHSKSDSFGSAGSIPARGTISAFDTGKIGWTLLRRDYSRTVSIATNVEVLATCGRLEIFSPST